MVRTLCAHNVHNGCMTETRSIHIDEEVARYWRLNTLVRRDFGGDNLAVVDALKEITGQTVTVRGVQAWLVAQDKKSHRRAPDWVVKGLETFLQMPEKAKALADRLERTKARRTGVPDSNWAEEVWANHAVEFATREMEDEVRERQRWRDACGLAIGDLLYERFQALEKEVSSSRSALSAVIRAIEQSATLEDLKTRVVELTQVQHHVGMYVRQARAAIEKGADEFSNPEGLPGEKARANL